jgi:UDP-2,4-diacetamido-2,4,6-trideoxy-beta-L-altropyranose hydrolase
MKVSIITEGSNKIGFGHVTRCLSIYQAFEERGVSPLLIINGDNIIESLLKNYNYKIFKWLENTKKLFNIIKDSDIIIIDSYLADYNIYKTISNFTKIIVYLDDNNRIEYPKGIILNGSIYAQELEYPIVEYNDLLLGSQYIPLRKEFWEIPEKTINKNVNNVMITFGGDDLRNLTPKILKALNEQCPQLKSTIIIGKGFSNIEVIKKIVNDRNELIFNPNAQEMVEIMFRSDIAISAAGQTLNELARIGTPTITVSVASNQVNHINYWDKTGFIQFAGAWNDDDLLNTILENIKILKDENMRRRKSEIGRKHVDGLGPVRIVEYCLRKLDEMEN